MSVVYYHIPTDQDDPEIPNAFAVPKPLEDISMSDILGHFPLPGDYHFRIRTSSGWLDLKSDHPAPLPVGGKRIVLKVLRLSWTKLNGPSKSPKFLPNVSVATKPTVGPPQLDLFDLGHLPANVTAPSAANRSRPIDDFDSLFR
jgi:hypothetical protein